MTTTLGSYQYSIDPAPTFTVHIWGGSNSDPNGPELYLQPHNPIEGNPAWPDEATAEAWAVQTINNLINPPAPAPATPTAAEIQAAQTILAASGYTVSAPADATSTPTSTTTVTTPSN